MRNICDICLECHERDKNAVKCGISLKHHYVPGDYIKVGEYKCDICGKRGEKLYFCPKYLEMTE